MDRALKILAAMFATASMLTAACLVLVAVQGVIPHFAELQATPQKTALIGLGFGYLAMFVVLYARAAWLIWRRAQWKQSVFLAAASCLGFPIGLFLGLLALLLLTRPAARAAFTS